MYSNLDDFASTLELGEAFYFHWKIETDQPHYQIILNKPNEYDSLICMSIATSQIEKRENYIKRKNFPAETLVIVEVWEVTFLKKRSCFNCNSIETYSVESLFSDYLMGKLKPAGTLPIEVLERIFEWIKKSDAISLHIKKKIFGDDYSE